MKTWDTIQDAHAVQQLINKKERLRLGVCVSMESDDSYTKFYLKYRDEQFRSLGHVTEEDVKNI